MAHLDRDPDAELRAVRLWRSMLCANQQRHAHGSPTRTLYAQAILALEPLIAHFEAEMPRYGGEESPR
jgi:hypothetical protein